LSVPPSSLANRLGGYDEALDENVATLTALQSLCDNHLLSHYTISSAASSTPPADVQVLFLLNFSTAQRSYLLTSPNTLLLLYTPSNEHFGIVPIEAGACGLPVLATNTGGPLETILDPQTGLLRKPDARVWAEAMEQLINLPSSQRQDMSRTAKKRVKEMFSLDTLGRELEESCREALKLGDLHTNMGDGMIWGSLGIMGASVVALGLTFWLSQ
jgi:alpha-1,3/alpha-1,6-mannosyltransferase